jgi:hypothetical protein
MKSTNLLGCGGFSLSLTEEFIGFVDGCFGGHCALLADVKSLLLRDL